MSQVHRPAFVFFHVGSDTSLPTMLTKTIKLTNPSAEVIQCSDETTPLVEGVDHVQRGEYDPNRLMIGRLRAFSSLGLTRPALYLDTDMLVIKPIQINEILQGKHASFCARSFNFYGPFIGSQRGLDFSEYAGQPLGEVYPYVACSTITQDWTVWGELAKTLEGLHPKFKQWYGDQEAMKTWAKKNPVQFKTHTERELGCLPEEKEHLPGASILHFKGVARKPLMLKLFQRLCG